MRGKLLAINGDVDHLHLLIEMPTIVSVAEMMQKVKGGSAKWIHDTFPDRAAFERQRGYGAFSISQSNVTRVKRSIEQQKTHHARLSFRDEFVRLLDRHELVEQWVTG